MRPEAISRFMSSCRRFSPFPTGRVCAASAGEGSERLEPPLTLARHPSCYLDLEMPETVSAHATVTAVHRSPVHEFSKDPQAAIRLLEGLGVEGDAHLGVTVQHRSRVAADPTQPNLRQVHLIQAELHDELKTAGFQVAAGQMGENITTRGIDLLGLPVGARLRFGAAATVEITGLRNPCAQLDGFQAGLMKAVLSHDEHGNLIRKAGIMGVVIAGGEVRPGDAIHLELPPPPHRKLERV